MRKNIGIVTDNTTPPDNQELVPPLQIMSPWAFKVCSCFIFLLVCVDELFYCYLRFSKLYMLIVMFHVKKYERILN